MTSSLSTEWVTIWNQVESGNIKLPLSTVQSLVHHVRRNLTRRINDASPECTTPFLLDDESSYDAPVEILDDCYNNSYAHSNDGSDPSFNSYAGAGRSSSLSIFLKYKKKVGRASIFRSRPEYFAPSDTPLTPEEAEARHKRGEEANYRKAYRAAADEAMASNCLTWVTLTFDDQHRGIDPQKDFERLNAVYVRDTSEKLASRSSMLPSSDSALRGENTFIHCGHMMLTQTTLESAGVMAT